MRTASSRSPVTLRRCALGCGERLAPERERAQRGDVGLDDHVRVTGRAGVDVREPCEIVRVKGSPEFQRRLARERLGIDPHVMPGGHLVALSQPRALADHLLGA